MPVAAEMNELMTRADILVSGATGRTGGAAIDTLLKMDRRVRAYVRADGDTAQALRERGAALRMELAGWICATHPPREPTCRIGLKSSRGRRLTERKPSCLGHGLSLAPAAASAANHRDSSAAR